MGRLRGQLPTAALAPVTTLLRELTGPAPAPWWALAFEQRQGVRKLLVHNQHLVQFQGAGAGDGNFEAQAMLISPMGQSPLPTRDFYTLLRDILVNLCNWLDRLEVALKDHLTLKDAAYKWPTRCSLIALPVGYPPGPTTLEADYLPLPMCDGSDPLPWTIRWHTSPRAGTPA